MIERRIVCEDEIFVHGQTKLLPDIGHDFRLLHRVNAQFAFKVLVEFNKVRRITGVVNHDFNHRGDHSLVVDDSGGAGADTTVSVQVVRVRRQVLVEKRQVRY